jgi:uncharacterized membrane-anchored protein
MNKYILLSAFVLVAAAQIYIPASMISEQEDILKTGQAFKFKTAPVDPNDPFRGKYITLNFDHNVFKIRGSHPFTNGDEVFVHVEENQDGFMEIVNLYSEPPVGNIVFVKAKIGYITTNDDASSLPIEYPFNRYYMEESKAPEAEKTYTKAQTDSGKIAYALVKIKDGDAVLEDVMIDGVSIKELVETESED